MRRYWDTWMCVTDGGDYDNLGLVEAPPGGSRTSWSSTPAATRRTPGSQLYDGAEFDAYRELGACSVRLAMRESTGIAPAKAAGARREGERP
jgi:hypothetical protein